MAHSHILGGSSAARVLACPASVDLSKDIPPQGSSSYAEEGTALHEVMEKLWEEDMTMEDVIGYTSSNGVEITEELFVNKIIPAQSAVKDMFKRLEVVEYETEAVVQYTPVEDSFGTCDLICKGRDDLVVIADYKFGFNAVSPVNNKQLMYYAIATMHDPEFKDFWTGEPEQAVVLAVIQPNDTRPDALWTWETTAKELVLMDMALRNAVYLAKEGGQEPVMGEHCTYCPAHAVCPRHIIGAKSANALKEEHLNDMAVALALVSDLEPWIRKVKKFAHEQMERGDKIEGYKLVDKAGRRQWAKDDATVQRKLSANKVLKEYWCEESLRSPPQVEKICKAKGIDFSKFDAYIEVRSSGTTVVPESDKRSAVVTGTDDIPENMK